MLIGLGSSPSLTIKTRVIVLISSPEFNKALALTLIS